MWRRTKAEGVERAELYAALPRASRGPEHPLLDPSLMDTDRPAAHLMAVDDQVIRLGERLAGSVSMLTA